jgi:type IV pilus assembly protein PilY1
MPQAGGDGGNPSAATLLANVGGNTATIPLPSNTAKNNIADEYARFLYQSDVGSQPGTQNIITYTIAVYDPSHMTGNDPDMIMLMTSMANQGGGRYFAATDTTTLRNALETILTEIQAVNSVFASSTLPVSVNVRGTYLNQVYMGVFRPDPDAAPRWMGNLKEYRLAVSGADQLYLADANGSPVENSTTGFVTPTAISYWTTPSTYWGFRPSGAGGSSDSPDGDIVEKGAVAQVLRTTHASSQAARKVYTCGTCSNEALSGAPFDTGNGAITEVALGVATTDRDRIINWVRGQDVADENGDFSATDVRASIHGDVLHSRPAVVNYNRNGDDNDIVVFYGGNDALLRAVKGGQSTGGGEELWAFVAPEFYAKLKRLADNTPKISGADPRPYFFDGMIGVWSRDADNDGKLVPGGPDGDKVYLYVTARRGARLLYGFDVTDPDNPRVMWKRGCPNPSGSAGCDPGYGELGQTWSLPQAVKVRDIPGPVIFMGAGYDPAANDALPATAAGMGRGIMAIDGITGNVIWHAGASPGGASFTLTVPGMDHSVASDLTVLDRDFNGFADRVYIPDTGGKIWRADIDPDPSQPNSPSGWNVTLLASLGGTGASARKLLFPPDVVYANGTQTYDAVLIGSGDREHPVDTSVNDRFYMLKDTNTGPLSTDLNIVESELFDATGNLIQDGTSTERASAKLELTAARGWYIALGSGEKVVGNSITLAGTTFFGTNRPTPPAPGVCTPNLGEARLYSLSYLDGSATLENNGSAGLSLGDRSRVRPGGGYPPSFVPISIQINGKIHQGVISGTQVITSPVQAGKRRRTFWFREMDK